MNPPKFYKRMRTFLGLAAAVVGLAAQSAALAGTLRWSELPPVPDTEGFASPFAGVAGGALLVAGGANFPAKRPWEGGRKTWHDTVYALGAPDGKWVTAGRLPRPLAYGVSVSFRDKLICAGGGDAREHFRDVFALTWDGRTLGHEPLPSLPQPCAFMSGVLAGNTLYLLGGTAKPSATAALDVFWALDLATPGASWRELPPCPGPAREQAVMAAIGDTVYVISGDVLSAGPDGKPVLTYRTETFAYTASTGWKRLADVPHATEAALSPAPVMPDGRILVVSGDDGTRRHLDGPDHPGFPRDMLAYDPATDRWENLGEGPASIANVPSAVWHGRWLAICGEQRPGIRSNKIWVLDFQPPAESSKSP